MASHWMREVKFTEDKTNGVRDIASKFIYFFLRYVLGYTHVDQNASDGKSFQTYEKTGTIGSFTGSSFRFTDLSSSFVAGDVNKWILIVDTTNPENCGWYQIVNFVDVDNVDINFKTAIDEYPTAASGLTWYLIGEDYDVPHTDGDWWRLRTPHTDAWEVELQLSDFYEYGNRRVFQFRVSLDQVWTASGKILGPCTGTCETNTEAYATYSTHYYVEGDSDGSYLHFFTLYSHGGSQDARAMCSIVPMIPWNDVPSHSAEEKIALMGGRPVSYGGHSYVDSVNAISRINCVWDENSPLYTWSNLYVWRNAGFQQVKGGTLTSSKYYPNQSFTGLPTRQLNSRRGGNDTRVGSPAIIDYNNAKNSYELGILGGHESIRDTFTGMQVISQIGTRDKVHVGGGVLLPWPGFTPTFTVG